MKIKKLTALILSFTLVLLLLFACTPSEDALLEPEDATYDIEYITPAPHVHDENCDHSTDIDFEAAITAFAPDTVMIKADNFEITWAEMYIFLFGNFSNVAHQFGTDLVWLNDPDDGPVIANDILEYSADEAISFFLLEYGAKQLGLTINDDDLAGYNDDIQNFIDMYESQEEFETVMRDNGGFYNLDLFRRLFLVSVLIDELYDSQTLNASDERAAEYAEENDYLMAMHILRLRDDDSDIPLNEIKEIQSELSAHLDSEDLVEIFADLMNEQSEDPGKLTFPGGYIFVFNDMVREFSEATVALEFGQVSDIVETNYGYHIILRLPIDYDVVPIGAANQGIHRTVRQLAAFEDFDVLTQGWYDSLNYEFTPEFKSINLAEIFKVH